MHSGLLEGKENKKWERKKKKEKKGKIKYKWNKIKTPKQLSLVARRITKGKQQHDKLNKVYMVQKCLRTCVIMAVGTVYSFAFSDNSHSSPSPNLHTCILHVADNQANLLWS